MRPFSDVDLHAFVDNQISPERREIIASYLKTAPTDAARVESWRRQNDAIRTVFSGAATEPVPLWLTIGHLASSRDRTNGVADKISSAKVLSQIAPRRSRAADDRRSFWKFAAVAAIAFLAGLSVSLIAPQWTEIAAWWAPASARVALMHGFSRRVAEAHTTFGLDADHPVEVADLPEGALTKWFRHRVSFPVRVPDLRNIGWMLRGGRLTPGDLGPAALLVYEDADGDRLSLYVGQVANPVAVDTSFEMMPNQTLAWMDGPIGFGVATSKESPWLAEHAHQLYRGVYSAAAN